MMNRIPESESIADLKDARRFNEVMGKGLVQDEYRRLAVEVMNMGIPNGGRVLDLGTGTGFVAMEVAALLNGSAHVVGLDLSQAMLAIAGENASRRGLEQHISWQQGDGKDMPFPDDHFDFVLSSGSLHHWDNPLAIFNEVDRVLKPGGGFLIRDSKRLHRPLARFTAWLIGLTLPADFRVHYWGSIRSSYQYDELEQIVQRSRLQNWVIVEDFFDLAVKSRSPNQNKTKPRS